MPKILVPSAVEADGVIIYRLTVELELECNWLKGVFIGLIIYEPYVKSWGVSGRFLKVLP